MTQISISAKAITVSQSFGSSIPPLAKAQRILKKTDMVALRERLGKDGYKESEAINIAFQNKAQRKVFLKKQYEENSISIRTRIDMLKEEVTKRKLHCLINRLRKIKNNNQLSDEEKNLKSEQVCNDLVYYYQNSKPWWSIQFEFVVHIAKNFCKKSYVQ
jgi:hypothetical protein